MTERLSDSNHHYHHHLHADRDNPQSLTVKLYFSLALTLAVFFAELIGGFWTNSLALLSDAWHVLADAAALGLTLFAFKQAKRNSDSRNTFGFYRAEVLAAFINAVSLIVISGWIMIEAIQRFLNPVTVRSREMFIIALLGMIANLLIALLLNKHAGENMNLKGAFLHVVGDTLASLGVILGGLVMLFYSWYWVDPLISAAIGLLILKGAYSLSRESLHILMEGAPPKPAIENLVQALEGVLGVKEVHDLHLWSLTSQIPCLSFHAIIGENEDGQRVLDQLNRLLAEGYSIFHTTIQLEQKCAKAGQLTCNPG